MDDPNACRISNRGAIWNQDCSLSSTLWEDGLEVDLDTDLDPDLDLFQRNNPTDVLLHSVT